MVEKFRYLIFKYMFSYVQSLNAVVLVRYKLLNKPSIMACGQQVVEITLWKKVSLNVYICNFCAIEGKCYDFTGLGEL